MLSRTIAIAKCPDAYRRSDESLTCESDCIWRWSTAPIKCRHECGLEAHTSKWNAFTASKQRVQPLCFGAILNSVYLITQPHCLTTYNASDLVIISPIQRLIWTDMVQSTEVSEHFAFIKLKLPMRFGVVEEGFSRGPICVDKENDATVINDSVLEFIIEDWEFCYDTTAGTIDSCRANYNRCLLSFGSAYIQPGYESNDDVRRRFLQGIGLRPFRLGEDENNFYKCNVRNYKKFFYQYFIDQ